MRPLILSCLVLTLACESLQDSSEMTPPELKAPAMSSKRPPKPSSGPPLIDLHVHVFGVGDKDSGCYLSEKIKNGLAFKVLGAQLRLKERADTFDEGYELALLEAVKESGLDRVVLLAQDGVYGDDGLFDRERTHVYVPNDYVFEVVERNPDFFIPCVSINPDRRDALEELDRCVKKGARILKIHPPIQGVDVSDEKHTPFFRRCARENILVMVHTGHEHSAPVVDIHLADPRRLALALDAGCTVVACHCGTGWASDEPDFFPHFVEMVSRYENLWGDTSVLGSAGRVESVRRLLAAKSVHGRLLHGSDFPFPPTPIAFTQIIGLSESVPLQAETNWLRCDLDLKEALGFGKESARRVATLLEKAGVAAPQTAGPGVPASRAASN